MNQISTIKIHTSTNLIYDHSLNDALPISSKRAPARSRSCCRNPRALIGPAAPALPKPESRQDGRDRKSTRLNSSHVANYYAIFFLKKINKTSYHDIINSYSFVILFYFYTI